MTIEPACPITSEALGFDADGMPFNTRYGDIYASRDGALGQARHVFLAGNELPARWANADQFVIVETGFGLGTNFLAAWQAWRRDPARPRRLFFVSVELHPLAADVLRAQAPAELASLADELASAWPLLLPGLHRCEFDGGAVALTLALGDARRLVPQLVCGADAFFLDGFAPDRNPQMWEAPLLKALARLAREGATLATWCTACAVRDALAAAGFVLQLQPGFGRKREMLTGRFAPRWRVRRHEPPRAWHGARRAIVIGAGLAGANAAHALARRGWQVQVMERGARIAAGASALPWGLLHPQITADDSVFARLTRAGFFASRAALARIAAEVGARDESLWAATGVFQQAGGDADNDASPPPAKGACALDYLRAARSGTGAWGGPAQSPDYPLAARSELALGAARRAQWPPQFCAWLDAGAAADRLGLRPQRGGWWFADGALVAAARWCATALAHPAMDVRCGSAVARVARDDEAWCVFDAAGAVLARAPVLVVASAFDAPRLLGRGAALARPVRGRISRIDDQAICGLRAGLAGDGYLVRGPDGWAGVGATYETPVDGDESITALDEPRAHASNLARLQRLLAEPPSVQVRGVFDALRCVSRDRLPCVGPAVDADAVDTQPTRLRGAHPIDLPRRAGLYASYAFGSRGLSLAALAGELIAAHVEGEPAPIERDLVDAIDPARELLRAIRHGRVRIEEEA